MISLPWKPHAKQRPRAGRNGVVYTPKATKDAERAIREAYTAQVPDGYEPTDQPIAVTIGLSDNQFTLDVNEVEPHTQRKLRGDIDNYAKTILDALNGVAWVDDRQITHLTIIKE